MACPLPSAAHACNGTQHSANYTTHPPLLPCIQAAARAAFGENVTAFDQITDGERSVSAGDVVRIKETKPLRIGRVLYFTVPQVLLSCPHGRVICLPVLSLIFLLPFHVCSLQSPCKQNTSMTVADTTKSLHAWLTVLMGSECRSRTAWGATPVASCTLLRCLQRFMARAARSTLAFGD